MSGATRHGTNERSAASKFGVRRQRAPCAPPRPPTPLSLTPRPPPLCNKVPDPFLFDMTGTTMHGTNERSAAAKFWSAQAESTGCSSAPADTAFADTATTPITWPLSASVPPAHTSVPRACPADSYVCLERNYLSEADLAVCDTVAMRLLLLTCPPSKAIKCQTLFYLTWRCNEAGGGFAPIQRNEKKFAFAVQLRNSNKEGTLMRNKISIRFFDDREVRAVWDDKPKNSSSAGWVCARF
jgi:hypothetical protein